MAAVGNIKCISSCALKNVFPGRSYFTQNIKTCMHETGPSDTTTGKRVWSMTPTDVYNRALNDNIMLIV